MKRDDTLWKAILEEVFDDFLLFFFPDANELFDLDRGFEYLDKELEQLFPPEHDHYSLRFVDKLVKVYTAAGAEQWVLVHIEVQGYQDPLFAERMFTYYYRIFDKYSKPIVAFAIFTDDLASFKPAFFEQHFLGTRVRYEFNIYKITEQSEEELLRDENPFAQVVLTAMAAIRAKGKPDEVVFDMKMGLFKRLLSRNINKKKIRALMNFLRFYIHFDNPEMYAKFENRLEELTQNRIPMGIEEFLLDRAKREGIEGERMNLLRSLIAGTDFTDDKIAVLVGVPVEQVRETRKSMTSS